MEKFQLLKQTFPISQFDRECDGYNYIIENVPTLNQKDLQKIIKEGEKYLYRVGKENGRFKAMHISLSNFELIRKHYFKLSDEG